MAPPRSSRLGLVALFGLLAGYSAFVLLASARASPLRPPSPRGVDIPEWMRPGAELMGLDPLTTGGLTVLAILLLAALVAVFAVICREAWKGRMRLVSLVLVGALSLGIVTAGPLVLSRDVYSYASYGRMYALYDTNPYQATPVRFGMDPFTAVVSEEWRNTSSVYGPAFTLLSAGIAGATRNSTTATVWAFKLLAAVAVGLAAYLAAAAARVVRPGTETFAAAAVGLNPLMVIHVAGAGHNDALVAALLAGALLVAVRAARSRLRPHETARSGGSSLSAASAIVVTVLITLAALVKVIGVIPLLLWLAYLLRSSRPGRRVGVAAIQLAGAAGLTVVVTAPLFAGSETVTAIGNVAGREGWASSARLVARTLRALTGVERGSSPDVALSAGVYLGFLAVFVTLAWRLFRATDGDPGAAWGGGLLLFALAASYLLPWYAAWFLPFVPFLMHLGLGTIALAVAGLLALTGVPAEPGFQPSVWQNMMLAVHYGVAPAILALLFLAAVRVRRLPTLSRGEAAP